MKFLNPDRLVPALKETMEDYERFLLARWPGARILVHSDYRAGDSGQHGLGHAADFHVENVTPVDAWLALERFSRITGVGLYPHWLPVPGLHADVRAADKRARWARGPKPKEEYVAADAAALKLFMGGGA